MKKWLCKVCGYVHEGDSPPETCPVCGVGPEEFVLQAEPSPAAAAPKRWKCKVCDYIHDGDEPPAVCPVCGVGREEFILLAGEVAELTAEAMLATDEGTINAALDAVSYGLYVVSAVKDGRINGQTANAVFQVTASPPQIAICLNKNNLTTEFVLASGKFAVSILAQDQGDVVRTFGYQSGRTADKFAAVRHLAGKNGCPVLKNCLGYLEAEVLADKTVDVGTHMLFVARVTAGKLAGKSDALTYAFFRRRK
jgi:flavin reductase (DIM6/NTAB) family NADH-FMN oxidoreductase RutF/rubredoxin